ncbi:psd [Pungitius sinensis]
MSQSGKVLHLYVEVRSAADQSGGKEGVAQGRSVQDAPAELLSQFASQSAVAKSSAAHRLAQERKRSPSRGGFRLQPAGGSGSPTAPQRGGDWPSGVRSPARMSSSGKVSAPHTPLNCSRGKVCDGTRSVVTFGYIEKSNVRALDSPRSSLCERGTREERSTPSHYCNRFSDPVWFGSPDSPCSSSPKMSFRSPGVRRPALDPIGRAATQRAVEEFGSPLLRIKLAHALEQSASSRCHQQAHCRSWSGSPVQRQSTSTNLVDHLPDRSQAACGLPQSPASDQPSSQSCINSRSPLAGSPSAKRHVHRSSTIPQAALPQLGNNVVEGLNQLSDSKSSSAPHSPDRQVEEATKVSSNLTEERRPLLHNPTGEFHKSAPNAQQSKPTLMMNIPLNDPHTPATDNTTSNSHQPENSTLTLCETNTRANREDCVWRFQRQSPMGSPAVSSRVFQGSHPPTELSSPMRDPRLLQAELRAPDTPTLHRRRLPRCARDSWSLGLDKRGHLSSFERGDCTELARRLFINQGVEEAPVSWTSRQQWWNQPESSPSPKIGFVSGGDQTPGRQPEAYRRLLGPTAQQKRAEQRRREILLLGPVALDSPEEDEGCEEEGQEDETEGHEVERQRADEPAEAEQNGAMRGSSSRSSSGVTGTLGDRDCVSPGSSQSSHQSNETGAPTSGIQTDSGCAGPVPSLHCQRIARAKWEFLFGTQAEETTTRGETCALETSTAPPSGNSSESPTPTPPSSLPLLSANHEVQHVEVELVTPPPTFAGASPKTGIIRRTLKYSETDLDAVPLRCYRETDIDEVLLAELDDGDSAFGSNRSVQGTSGTGSSPLGGPAYGGEDGAHVEERRVGEEDEEEEEEEEEEDMVSWASVRMQGDNRKQQFAAQEQPEVFGHMLKRTMETFFDNHHPALKSPLLVSGPRCAAEDTFSRHFESIMESHRAKGTSYNSLDSEELLTSSAQTALTFDLPTLTPAIHGPVCPSARQIVQLSFAPLAHDERPSISDSIFTVTGDSDATRAPSSERLSSGSEDTPPKGRGCSQLGSSWYSNPSFSLLR